MIKATVNIVTTAQVQIADAVDWIAQRSPANADAWEDRLRAAIARIGDLPDSYSVDVRASDRLGQVVRKVTFERTYLIFYRHDPTRSLVEVIGFRHGARLPGPHEP